MRRVAAPDPRPRVLFVEDERSITEPFSRALAREGFDPVVAHTAAEAMARFEEREPDIVLLDISLPDGDGRDICREFRRRSDVPIIMLTARGTETDKIVGLELAAGERLDDVVVRAELTLSRKEFDLLAELTAHAGTVVSREDLMSRVWDENWFGSTKTLDVHIRWLRQKLGDDPASPRFIHTVRGVGFRFTAPGEWPP